MPDDMEKARVGAVTKTKNPADKPDSYRPLYMNDVLYHMEYSFRGGRLTVDVKQVFQNIKRNGWRSTRLYTWAISFEYTVR